MNNLDIAIQKSLSRFKPPLKVALSDWAEKNIFLSDTLTEFPGYLDLSMSPYMKHILDAIDNPKYNKFTWISSVQTGKTLFQMILAAYFMSEDPSNILLFEPDGALARSIAVERFNPLIACNPFLKSLFTSQKAKNNDEEKIFTGGYLNFCSAGSLNAVISRSARIVLLDEVDSYVKDLKDKGNPIKLAEDRTIQQPRSKFIMVGSPKGEDSELFRNYDNSNQAVVEYACLYCGEYQELKFRGKTSKNEKYGLVWDEGSEGHGEVFRCKYCLKDMREQDKFRFFKNSRLKCNTDSPVEKNHFGLWTNGLYSMSPKLTWEQIAIDHVSAHRRKDKADRKSFTNSILAEKFIDPKHNIKESWLMGRAKEYYAEVPRFVGILTAGIDIQHNRIEVSVLGFGKTDKIAVIDHRVIYGSTFEDPDKPDFTVWKELDLYLDRPFQHESGRDIYIKTAFIDVSDGANPAVKKYAHKRMVRGILPIAGRAGKQVVNFDGYYGPPMQDRNTKMPIIPVNTIMVKDEIYDRLLITDEDTYRCVIFPKHLDEGYYKGLLSERAVEKRVNGVLKRTYEQTHTRNEQLDCFCYAFTAFKREFGRNMYVFEQVCDLMESKLETPVKEVEVKIEEPKIESSFDFFAAKNKIAPRHLL